MDEYEYIAVAEGTHDRFKDKFESFSDAREWCKFFETRKNGWAKGIKTFIIDRNGVQHYSGKNVI